MEIAAGVGEEGEPAKEKENKKNYALVLRVSCPEVRLVTNFG